MSLRRPSHSTAASDRLEIVSGSFDETQAFGEQLGRLLQPGDVIALHGPLGGGKTTLIQGVACGLGLSADLVKSPTFVLLREYPGDPPLIHVDGYRLDSPQQATWLDDELVFSPHKVTVIEWADRFAGLLPDDRVEVSLAHVSTNRRRITIGATGPRSTDVVKRMQAAQPSHPPDDGRSGD